MSGPAGVPIVLTADRTLMADHRTLFGAMVAASQTTATPRPILTGLLAPRARCSVAPMGLRRVEAALLGDGFAGSDVCIVPVEGLSDVIGRATRIIGVSAGEVCGLGMNSTTMTAISGGEIYVQRLVRELTAHIAVLRRRAPGARVVFGGPGAWQLVDDDGLRRELGVDHVVTGPVEGNIAELFRALADGAQLPTVIAGREARVEAIPPIQGATTMGVVELSRGCGLGCRYCVMGRVPMRHLPASTILADVETNLAAGLRSMAVISEDVLRFGSVGPRLNPRALLGLLRSVRELPKVGLIQTDHANIASVGQYSDEELAELRALMVGASGCRFPWLNLGVETPDGELLARSGPGKLGGVDPARWGEFCAEQLRRLIAAGFMPMASLMLCLPGETPEHVQQALEWVASVAPLPLTVFPVVYAPIDGSAPPGRERLTPLHWRLIRACYEINFREVPRMFGDNQAAAGVPLTRRIALQALGRLQVAHWRRLFAARARCWGGESRGPT
ncbi:MAG: radical SAM protein [Armatimonadota bacterium]